MEEIPALFAERRRLIGELREELEKDRNDTTRSFENEKETLNLFDDFSALSEQLIIEMNRMQMHKIVVPEEPQSFTPELPKEFEEKAQKASHVKEQLSPPIIRALASIMTPARSIEATCERVLEILSNEKDKNHSSFYKEFSIFVTSILDQVSSDETACDALSILESIATNKTMFSKIVSSIEETGFSLPLRIIETSNERMSPLVTHHALKLLCCICKSQTISVIAIRDKCIQFLSSTLTILNHEDDDENKEEDVKMAEDLLAKLISPSFKKTLELFGKDGIEDLAMNIDMISSQSLKKSINTMMEETTAQRNASRCITRAFGTKRVYP